MLLFLGSVVLLAYYTRKNKRGDTGAIWFGLAFLFAGLGLGLQSQRGLISPLYSILLGNFFYMLMGPFLNRAMGRVTKQKDQFTLLMLMIPATIANYAYFTYMQPNVLVRTVEAVFVMSVMHLTTATLLLRSREKAIEPATRAMAALLILHIIPGTLRSVMAVKLYNADAYFSMLGTITIAGLALSFLWVSSLRMEEELEQQAMTDPLTGLFNRRALDMIGPRELQRGVRKNLPCSALMMDIDRFKDINDTLGHAAGDASLCAMADALKQSLRASDIATRLGGDEFFVMLPDTDEHTAALVAERLRSAIAEIRVTTVTGEEFSVAASIGCATMRKEQLTVDDLLHASDILLYREKQISRVGQPPDGGTGQGAGLDVTGEAQVQPSSA